MNKIKISSLRHSSYIVEDSKKSKGKITLINKIKTFFLYVKNVVIFKSNMNLEKLSDNSLEDYIEFLNNENISVDEAVKKINEDFDKMEESLSSDESLSLLSETQGTLDALKTQKEKIDSRLDDAISEQNAREDYKEVEMDNQQTENEYVSSIPRYVDPDEEKELHAVELPMESNETNELPVESEEEIKPIDYEQTIEESNINPLTETKIDNEVDLEKPIEENSIEPVKPNISFENIDLSDKEDDIEIEIPSEQPKVDNTKNVEEEKSIELVAQPNPEEEKMNSIQNDYKNSIENIQKEYTENFGKEFNTIISKIMVETEKYANRQVEEITAVSKEAINNANNNTQRVLDEKAMVEKDRDQYKSHYEQSLNTVEEKNRTIDSKDAEIKALKEEIERKNQEISNRDKNIQELNTSIAEKDGRIANYESKIEDYKVTLATMTRELGRNFQIASQMEVEEQEVSKTK